MSRFNNHQFYIRAFKEYGISAKGVHWNCKYNQYKRFEVITSFILKDLKNSNLVDCGCGFGEYLSYLRQNSIKYKEYIGLDCEKHMIEISKKRFKLVKFYEKNILEDRLVKADYYICSGAMNLLSIKDVKQFIKRCFHCSKKGFIFNLLYKDSFIPIDKNEIIKYCNELSNEVLLKDDYLSNDFTIFMKK